MRVCLLDLLESPRGCNNKEVTGTYGSVMVGDGGMSSVFAWLKRRQLRMPVVSMSYLNAIFKTAGHETHFADRIPTSEYDLVLMPTSIVGAPEEQAAARTIKSQFPDTKIGFFGSFAPVDQEAFLQAGDFVIKGEPEAWAREYAQDPTSVSTEGLVESEKIKDLDSLPDPSYDGFPIHTYSYAPLLKNKPFLPVTTARGCPFDCYYCPYMVDQGKLYRRHSVERVIRILKKFIDRHGVRSFLFRDIVFSMNKKRTRELCQAIIDANLNIRWGCETRIDCLDRELVDLMKQSGCEVMHFGVESVDNEILGEAGRKGMELDHQRDIVHYCEDQGIKTVCFYILGFINDTQDSMRRTIDYATQLNSSMAQFGIMTPYPGTRLFEQIEDRVLTRDWSQYTTYTPVVKLDHLTHDEVLQAKREAYRRYFMRGDWLTKRLPKLLFS